MDALIARLAARQHGNVTRAQLLNAGLSASSVDRRLRRGLLIPRFRGVYRVGHTAPSAEAEFMAAVLASGAGALLSGKSAARLLGLVAVAGPALWQASGPGISPVSGTVRPTPEVTVSRRVRVDGVQVRCSTTLAPSDRITVPGIPCTSVPRTLVRLAALLEPADLAIACHNAQVRYRTSPRHIEEVLARITNSPGAAALRRTMVGGTPVSLSVLERRFLALLRRAGLPLPQTNRRAGSFVVDCRWPEHHLTVELDSYRFHNTRLAWERDRRREREAHARGDGFRRFSWSDVTDNPASLVAELRSLLRAPQREHGSTSHG